MVPVVDDGTVAKDCRVRTPTKATVAMPATTSATESSCDEGDDGAVAPAAADEVPWLASSVVVVEAADAHGDAETPATPPPARRLRSAAALIANCAAFLWAEAG